MMSNIPKTKGPSRSKIGFALAGLAAAAALSIEPFRFHLAFYRTVAPWVPLAFGVLVALWIVAALLWTRVPRVPRLWELPVVAGLLVCGCLYLDARASIAVAGIMVSAALMGAHLAARCRLAPRSNGDRLWMFPAVGLAALLVAATILGLFGVLRAPVIAAGLAGACWLSRRHAVEVWASIANAGTVYLETRLSGALTVAALPFLIIGWTAFSTPPAMGDSVTAHLQSVRAYAETGSLAAFDALPYSYFPQSFEVLAAMAYSLGGQRASQWLAPVIAFAFALVLFQIVRECGLPCAGAAAGVLLFFTIPFVHWSSVVIKNDLLLCVFQGAALLCILRLADERQAKWLIAAACFTGLSFSVKHTAVFGAASLAVAGAIVWWRLERRWATALAVVAVMVLTAGPWLLRTYLAKGNPFYPIGARSTMTAMSDDASVPFWLLRYPKVVLDVHFAGQYAFESPTPNPVGLALLLFLPLSLVSPPLGPSRARRRVWVYVAVYFVLWCTMLSTLRYALLPIGLLVAIVIGRAVMIEHAGLRIGVAIASVLALSFGLLAASMIEIGGPHLRWLIDHDDRAMLRALVPPYAALEMAATRARPGDWIFAANACVGAYAPHPRRFACDIRPSWTREELQARLSERPYRFVILPVSAPRIDGAVVYQDAGFALVARE